jgi:hypothetical protein
LVGVDCSSVERGTSGWKIRDELKTVPGGRDLRLMADSGALEAISASLVPIDLTGGKTTRFDLGGQGRRVQGRLRPPPGHKGAVLRNFAVIDAQPKSDEEGAEPGMRCDATVGRDGACHFDDLPAGE